jgi:hypothetical protein
MISTAPCRVRDSLSLAALLSFVLALCTLTACHSSKSKETPEQVAENGLAKYQEDIRRVVKDPARAKQLVELSSEFQDLVNEAAQSFKNSHARLMLLNANYDATLDEFHALFDQADKERAELFDKGVALRTRMSALTTESEWTELKKARVAEWQDEIAEAQL